jgi:Flp pilus assembly protein TadG
MVKSNIFNNKGTSVVEMALVLPLLLILVFGVIEFGVFLYNQAVITNASREGARAGIVQALSRPTESDIQGVVTNYAEQYLINLGAAKVFGEGNTAAPDAPCTAFGEDLTVTVTYHYDFLVLPGFISSLVGGVDLSAVTIMRCE